ncbi:UDP-glycosyltransferase 73B3 [Camellia lanceoleosa]|uniref:UDP-glycosyltransferase 73B3 n=1 Tax=Camellia lanceoleosa TaxID=1840588 RepID=A0ACC0HKF4_9ERIC|nr:UDP-glycosyltransferase 73B3 [Camellia lanceoleosa]
MTSTSTSSNYPSLTLACPMDARLSSLPLPALSLNFSWPSRSSMNPSSNSSENAALIASSATCTIPGLPTLVLASAFPGLFSLCSEESIRRYAPHDKVNSDAETFALPGLPNDNIIFTKRKIPYWFKEKGTSYGQFIDEVLKSELKSYGVIVNSFYELEPVYAEYFKNEMGRKLCLGGPVCLFNKAFEEKAERGTKNSIDGYTILKCLDSKQPKSVLYVSFGS